MNDDRTPLLPETTFKPLSNARLEGMINHALTHQQLPVQARVINFNSWRQKAAFGTTMAAMAASILLAFMVTPQYTQVSTVATNPDLSADVSDLLLLESLES